MLRYTKTDVEHSGISQLLIVNRNIHKNTIYSLYKQPDDNRVIAGHAGVIDAIVKAMNTHINNTEICENSCAVLMDFINNGKMKLLTE